MTRPKNRFDEFVTACSGRVGLCAHGRQCSALNPRASRPRRALNGESQALPLSGRFAQVIVGIYV
jgi:hypothetical protein